MRSNREELLERMARAVPGDGAREALDGLFLARLTRPTESALALYQPAFCFVVQGGKQVWAMKSSGTTPATTSCPPQRDIARLRGSLEPGGAPARV